MCICAPLVAECARFVTAARVQAKLVFAQGCFHGRTTLAVSASSDPESYGGAGARGGGRLNMRAHVRSRAPLLPLLLRRVRPVRARDREDPV
jgi:hypothetical protein